ncbi:Heterokaryon incompatibility protein [Fusarium heterosporum]|uniref:Heterokaryon incompatibility protein n=1 Tax=Fusarium heterosporum TaxID=42747 RepID=A0A8H5T135_FUSHE|nr:Heterokaryon incompatibility protein [Fusarium heterosporum]
MKIERPYFPITFVALSYVWSTEKENERIQLVKGNVRNLSAPGSLKRLNLPPVIHDAILLCRKLGETYLWVDRFCIIQDDPESKHSQISGMHKIYRSASFTIVAALNDRDTQGLPGFDRRPRRPSSHRPERPIHNKRYRVIHSTLAVDYTVWNSRGWTFQERVLSTRLLFITEHEVYFQCAKAHAYENYATHSLLTKGLGVPSTPDNTDLRKKDRYVSARLGLEDIRDENTLNKPGFNTYASMVRDYTGRTLSFQSDILKAFAGVEGSLAETYDCPFIYGLPEKYFPLALMWDSTDGTNIRTEGPPIPSWSWASLNSKSSHYWMASYHGFPFNMDETSSRIVILVDFYYQDLQHGLRKLDEMEWWVDGKASAQGFFVSGQHAVSRYHHRMERYIYQQEAITSWKACPHNPWERLARSTLDPEACKIASSLPGCLLFNTTVAKVMSRDVQIISDNGRPIGHIQKRFSKTAAKIEGGKSWSGGVIVISGNLIASSEWECFGRQSDDLWELRVMLVEQIACQPYVVRRVGVGRIDANSWKLCTPRWETVVLC